MSSSVVNDISVFISKNAGYLERLAAKVFSEEVYKKTRIKVTYGQKINEEDNYIVIATEKNLKEDFADCYKLIKDMDQPGSEGYKFYIDKKNGIKIVISAADQRGAFYGMGRALRKLNLRQGSIEAGENLYSATKTPKYPLRGHQLGHRSKNNTHDAWTIEQYYNYIRELAIFGANSIEILPLKTDDDLYSQHFKEDPLETMIKLSKTIKAYGMDVWIWYPNVGSDYEDEETLKKEIDERDKIYGALPYVDAVFIPSGDPGHLHPKQFFAITEQCIKPLKKYHPNAKIWISQQASTTTQERIDSFFEELNKKHWWVDGMVFAPWTRYDVKKLRELTPETYPIRNYPDISHSLQAQYPVPEMDMHFGIVYGREAINPRPLQMKFIHNMYEKYTIGSITYSEGIHDDINKFVWMDQDWDPYMDVRETIEDYVRYFISCDLIDEITQAIFDLEQNWLEDITSGFIDETYNKWIQIEEKIRDESKTNFRVQMCLVRAYMDYYIKRRYLVEKEYEDQAYEVLRNAKDLGCDNAIEKAWFILDKKHRYPVCGHIREKLQRLSDSLFENIGIQLTVSRHRGQYIWRGAFMECLDVPMNDYRWLTYNFREILKLKKEEEKLEAINKIIYRTKVEEDEYYDNIGTKKSFKRLVVKNTYEEDPGYLYTPHIDIDIFNAWSMYIDNYNTYKEIPMPQAWLTRAISNYGTPLIVKYENLNSSIQYKIKVNYILAYEDLNYRLTAGDIVIHEGVKGRGLDNFNPIFEYIIPKEAYRDGTLELKWESVGNLGRIQIQELWLVKC